MNGKLLAGIFAICLVAVGIFWVIQRNGGEADHTATGDSAPEKPEQLVFAGDTQERVYEMLGQPNIEFPDNDAAVQWFAGYEVVVSNNVVTHVRVKPIESEEEKLQKERSAKQAEARLRNAYQIVAEKEQISYNAWLAREEARLQKEREDRAAVESYEERKSEEKKAAIYAEAIRKSCGCRHGHYCRHCR